jgi:sugar phosphate isomerase/epimerase
MHYGAMNFPVRPLLQEIETVSELGFDYLELTMDAPEAHYTKVQEQRDDIARALERCELGLICHLPTFISTADLTESLREASVNEVLKSMEVAATLQPYKVVLHPSYIAGLGLLVPEQTKSYAMKSLETIVERAHQLGLCLCLENMFPKARWLVEPEDFAEILEKFPTINLTLDTGHAHIDDRRGKRALDFIQCFPERIGHVHASDNFGKEDSHLPVGAGTVDFQQIGRALKERGYTDTVTVEVFSPDRDYLRISREKLIALFDVV